MKKKMEEEKGEDPEEEAGESPAEEMSEEDDKTDRGSQINEILGHYIQSGASPIEKGGSKGKEGGSKESKRAQFLANMKKGKSRHKTLVHESDSKVAGVKKAPKGRASVPMTK